MTISIKRVLCVLGLVVLGGCAAETGDTGAAEEQLGRRLSPTPVVFDTDMDFDDASALAYLCQEHHSGRIDLRAVTITNAGGGMPGSAIRHARCILEACGLPDVPVADSSEPGAYAAPPELVGAVQFVLGSTFAECSQSSSPSDVTAPELLVDTIRSSRRRVVLLTTGPLTNVASAFELDDAEAGSRRGPPIEMRIRKLVVMGGAVDVHGNLFGTGTETCGGTQEFNIWIDPEAASDVFARMRPMSVGLIPLDATNYVPVTSSFAQRLADDHTTPAAELVHAILGHPVIQMGIDYGAFYWWDPLAAAVASGHRGLVDYELTRISVVQDGADAGRTVSSSDGTLMRVAVAADGERFDDLLLDVLNGRSPDPWWPRFGHEHP